MTTAADNAAFSAALVRDHDFSRYAATLFASPERRQAMLALAAFDLEISRIPDQVSQPLPGEVRLQWWTDLLEGTERGGPAGHPIAAELLQAIRDFALPVEPLVRLIRAHTFDLYDEPMPNRAALNVYLDDVVGELIRANLRVLGGEPADHESLIRDAGRALGLTRIVARLAHDAARHRCFLPNDIMVEAHVTRDEIFVGMDTAGLRAVRGELIAAARQHMARAQAQIQSPDRAIRPALLPLVTLGSELDALVSSSPFAHPNPPSRLRVLWSQWRASR